MIPYLKSYLKSHDDAHYILGDSQETKFADANSKKGTNSKENSDVDEDTEMMHMLGFSGFESTKGKSIDDNKRGAASGAVSNHKKRVYRQYMNRRGNYLYSYLPNNFINILFRSSSLGGFNRPLDSL